MRYEDLEQFTTLRDFPATSHSGNEERSRGPFVKLSDLPQKIAVSEQTPEDEDEEVVIYYEDGHDSIGRYAGDWWFDGECPVEKDRWPTHWREILR